MIEAMQLAKRIGISYRQLDYWTTRGWLRVGVTGTGNQRHYAGAEVTLATRMAALVNAGVSAGVAYKVACGSYEDAFDALKRAVDACESAQPPAAPTLFEPVWQAD